MRSDKLLPALAVATMLVVAGCAGAVTSDTPDPGAATDAVGATDATDATAAADVNDITTDGTATVSAEPDLARITVAVEATAENASAARSAVAADVERLRSALTEAGYEPETVDFRLSPEYDHSRDERELVGYRAAHTLTFETEPDDAGSAVDTAVDNGATRVQNVQFTLTDERRAELREEALADAVDDARDTATTVADAANRSVGTELSIAVGSAGVSPYEPRVAYETVAADSASTSFEPGSVTVSATVTVTYELD
ncbi:SIMPL domain-containing protein [Halobaculum sp. CBA1158]|uniref:SIMPL domain-containing protein n=1 Tax=Halobaculum sp. CBA1158 TaxID=2904243 RepID=UPI001F1FDDAA|nr:SIMPL domain-containing protein [Halobaculum sp. CBA1158]UIP00029.1 SIMPL domain-containing protein [Halobaculum sp. CBA1158]